MNKKTLICGIINLFQNIFGIILILFNELFINMDSPFYEKFYEIFEIGLLIFICLASLLFYFQNNPKETIKYGFNEKIKNEEKENINNEIEEIKKNKKKLSKKLKIKKAIQDKRTIRLFMMVFLFLPTINLISNNLRMDESLSFLFGVLINIVGIISSILFGLIGDLIQFKILFAIFSGLLSLASFYYAKNYEDELLSPILISIFISFIFNGFNVIYNSHIMKVYEIDNFIEMWGIIRASEAIIQIFGIIFNFRLDIKSSGYKIIYVITGLFSLISLGLGLFEKDDIFDYNN